jgi:hypothetical protein
LGGCWSKAERKRFKKTRKVLAKELYDSDFYIEQPLKTPPLFLPPGGLAVYAARLQWKPNVKQLKTQRGVAPEGFTVGQDLAVSYWTFAPDDVAIVEWESSGAELPPPMGKVKEVIGRRGGYLQELPLDGSPDMASNVAALLALQPTTAGISTSSYLSTQPSSSISAMTTGIATTISSQPGRERRHRKRRRSLRSRPWFIPTYWLGWFAMMVAFGWFLAFVKYSDRPAPWEEVSLLNYNQGLVIGFQAFVILSVLAFSISPLGRRSTYPPPRFYGTFWFLVSTLSGVVLGVGAFLIFIGVMNGWDTEYGWNLLISASR